MYERKWTILPHNMCSDGSIVEVQKLVFCHWFLVVRAIVVKKSKKFSKKNYSLKVSLILYQYNST